MKTPKVAVTETEVRISLADFLKYYNSSIPEQFPRATTQLLEEFKESHASFFRKGSSWSIDDHRKRVMDWLTLNHKPRVVIQ